MTETHDAQGRDRTPEQTQYATELREFIAKEEAGTLTLEEELRGLCHFDWVNLDGFNDPEFTGLVVHTDDVLEILNRHASKVRYALCSCQGKYDEPHGEHDYEWGGITFRCMGHRGRLTPTISKPVLEPQVCSHCGEVGHLMAAHF